MKAFFKWTFFLILFASVAGGVGIGAFLYNLSLDLPQNIEEELHKRNDILPTVMYDREGNQVEELFLQRRIIIPFEQFPPHLIQALLASEDSRYFWHFGIDPVRMLKAFVINLQAGGFVQGASTLTQQTARLFLLTKHKKLIRKLKEILLAFRMEREFSKQQILTLYLNKVFLGNAEGVEAAAQGYFGKHASELTLSESALLVGLLPAPSRYNPNRNIKLAKERRDWVLQRMFIENFITEEERSVASAERIKLAKIYDPTSAATAYYVEHVRRYLLRTYGREMLYRGGLRVHLAMNLDYQIYAHEALQKGILDLNKRQGYRGPLKKLKINDPKIIPEAYIETYTKKNSMILGSVVQAVVMEVKEDQGIVSLGKEKGILEWSSLKSWKQRIIPEEKKPLRIKKISDVLEVGDVIQVRLSDFDFEKNVFRLQLYQEPLVNGAILSTDPHTGEILAMSGGYDHKRSVFNRAIQAKRQPGSAFKPIVYAAALDAGYTLNSMLIDSPRAYQTTQQITGEKETWVPKNYGNKLLGGVPLRKALVKSLNLPTIGLVEDLGPENVILYAQKLGITANMEKNLTLALGTFSTTLQNMVEAFGVFANKGQLGTPVYITRIENSQGDILEQNTSEFQPVISEDTAFLITSAMEDVVQHGTGRRARAIGRPSAGKTGTTNDSVDAWYLGYIPQLLTGVYVGFDTPRSMGRYETGSRAAIPVWVDFMKNATANLPTLQFPQPPGVSTIKIHKSGRRASPCDPAKEVRFEHFRVGTEPPLDFASTGECNTPKKTVPGNGAEKVVEEDIEL